MATQAGFDPNAFGPFGAIFQTYLSTLEGFSQGRLPFGGGFDTSALTSHATAPLKAAARCQLEMLGLLNRRTQAYMQVPARLAQCRTPTDVFNEQMAFWQAASDQYRDSTAKIADAWMQFVPWTGVSPSRPDRDYISFNNGAGKEPAPQTARQEPQGDKQRRVA